MEPAPHRGGTRIPTAEPSCGASGEVVGAPDAGEPGLEDTVEVPEPLGRPRLGLLDGVGEELGRNVPGPGEDTGLDLAEVPIHRQVALLPYRRELADPGAEAGHRVIQLGTAVEVQTDPAGSLPDVAIQMVADLLPRALAEPDVDQEDAVRADDPNQFRQRLLPAWDEVEHVARERCAEDVVGERQPGRVPDDQGKGRASSGLLDELREHRCRQVDPQQPDPGTLEREPDQPGPDPDLEARLTGVELGAKELGGRCARFRGQSPGLVVHLGSPVERDRPSRAHDTGTCFAGSKNGSALTIARRGPVDERTSSVEPSSMCEEGTHA